MMLRRALVIGAVIALSVGVAGCGGGTEAETVDLAELSLPRPKKIDITLDGYDGPQNVGVLMAYERGYFEDLGLEVWMRLPASRLNPLRYVTEEAVALAISHQPEVVLAREKDRPVVAFGSLVPQPTAAMIWLEESGIDEIADLEGRTVAITGLSYEMSFLESILAEAGLTLDDVEVELADYDLVPALVSGRADAILGSWNLEGAELEARGLEPVVTRVEDLGIPSYDELVLITRPDRLSEEPETIRAFMAALARGTAAAIEDPEAVVRLIAEYNPDKSRKAVRAEVEATLPLLSESGEMSEEQAGELVDWMREEGMIEQTLSAPDLLTNEYLPES